jgi:hypothetical protein
MENQGQLLAKEILNQLGGNKFLVMTGSKNLAYDNSSLSMHLTRNKSKAKYLKIELTSMDTYNMIFKGFNKKTFEFPVVKRFDGIYADQLQSIFTDVTGLYTKL